MNSLFLFLAPSTRKLDHTVLDQLTQPTGHKENSKRKNKEETLVGKPLDHMRKLQHAHLPKTRQFIPNSAES